MSAFPGRPAGDTSSSSPVCALLRYAVRDAYKCTADPATAGSSCLSGVTSSRIQKERPWVERIRSSCATRIPVTGVIGRSSWRDCQFRPSSKETKTPNSVPA